MKTFSAFAMVCAVTLASVQTSWAHGLTGGRLNFGVSFSWSYQPCAPGCGPGGGALAPWYTYWPMHAHFQTPAPNPYPNWPVPMTSSLMYQQPDAHYQGGSHGGNAASTTAATPQPVNINRPVSTYQPPQPYYPAHLTGYYVPSYYGYSAPNYGYGY